MTLLETAQAEARAREERRDAARSTAAELTRREAQEVVELREQQKRRRFAQRLGTDAYDANPVRGKEYVVVEDLVFFEKERVGRLGYSSKEVEGHDLYVLAVSSETLPTETYRPPNTKRSVYGFPVEITDDLTDRVQRHPKAVFHADGVLAMLANGAEVHEVLPGH